MVIKVETPRHSWSQIESSYAAIIASGSTYRSHDLDSVRLRLSQVLPKHKLEVRDTRMTLDFEHYVGRMGPIGLHALKYGNAVRVTVPNSKSCYLLHLILSGRCEISQGLRRVYLETGAAALIGPGLPFEKFLSAGARQIVVQIDRDHFERQLAGRTGLSGGLTLPLHSISDSGVLRSLRRLLAVMCAELAEGGAISVHPALAERFSEIIAGLALTSVSQRDPLARAIISPAVPYYIKRAIQLIVKQASDHLTPETLARACGVSARTLFNGFQNHLGLTPMQFIKQVRLDLARELLLHSSHLTIAEIAANCSFGHLGRFAAYYRRRFGEYPRTTRSRVAGSAVLN